MAAIYSVPLAVYDFAPVILFAIGYGMLTRMIYVYIDRLIAFSICIGVILCFIGGFFKATHKLIIASTEKDIKFMDDGLFIWQSIGFCFVAYSILNMYRKEVSSKEIESVSKYILIPCSIA